MVNPEKAEFSSAESSDKERSPFDEQWDHPEKMTLSGAEVEFYDISPESLKTETPTAMVEGWGGTPEMYRENIKTLVDQGRRTLAVDAPHGIDYNEGEMLSEEIDKMPDAVLRKIAALIKSLDEKQVGQIDAVAHSEGCLAVIVAATLYPLRFRDVVLVNPAGMIGKDNFWRLATSFSVDVIKGYVDEIRKNGISEPMLRSIREVGSSAVKDPIKAFREVLAISDAEIHELLIGMRANGIGISIVSTVDDGVFPQERLQKIITKDMVDGYFVAKGHHGEFQLNAEPYTKLADYALQAMQEKREKRLNVQEVPA